MLHANHRCVVWIATQANVSLTIEEWLVAIVHHSTKEIAVNVTVVPATVVIKASAIQISLVWNFYFNLTNTFLKWFDLFDEILSVFVTHLMQHPIHLL